MSQEISSVIGLRVNVISKANIRYEGVLVEVNAKQPDDPAITLSQVISHGTENRPVNRFIPPKPGTYERITFSGKDLEDISLVQPQDEEILNDDPSILSSGPSQLPAPIGTSHPPMPTSNVLAAHSTSDVHSPGKFSSKSSEVASHPPTRADFFDSPRNAKELHQPSNRGGGQAQQHGYGRNNRGGHQNNYHQGGGGYHNQNQYRGGYRPRGNQAHRQPNRPRNEKAQFDSDYDIEEANKVLAAELEKLEIKHDDVSEHSDEGAPKPNDAFGGFFDNLSCEIIDKANGVSNQPVNRRNERKLNADTFGNFALMDNRRGGYRGRGGYRRPYGNGNYRGGMRHGGGYNQGHGDWRRPHHNNNYNRQGYSNNSESVEA